MKRFITSLVLICVSCGAAPPEAENKPRLYTLLYDSGGACLRITINDIPVLWNESGGGRVDVTPLVRDGSNVLQVQGKAEEGPGEQYRIQVVMSAVKAPMQILATPAEIDGKLDPQKKGFEFTKTWEASVPIKWGWQSAEKIDKITDADREKIMAVIKEFSNAIQNVDMRIYVKLREVNISDWARFLDIAREAQEERATMLIKGQLQKPVEVVIRDRDNLEMVRCGGSLVYVCSAGDEANWVVRAVLERSPHGGRFLSWGPFLFGKLKGKWTILN